MVSYKLTTAHEAGNISPAPTVKQIKAWLETLAGLKPARKAGLLADYLFSQNRPGFSHESRRQVIDTLSAAIDAALHDLELEIGEGALPVKQWQTEIMASDLRLLLALSNFYKRLILDQVDYVPRLFRKSPLPGLVAELMQTSSKILDLCYGTHRNVPAGVWHDLNQTAKLIFHGAFAADGDLAEERRTFETLFANLLLETLADPYHCSAQERIWVRDVIARLGGLARIEDGQAAAFKGVFGIWYGSDAAPRPLSWGTAKTGRGDLVLNTTPLVRKLALAIHRMESGQGADPLLPLVRHPDYIALLKRMKLCWGGSLRRMSIRRTPAKPFPCEAVLGFFHVHDMLGGQPAMPEPAPVPCDVVNESLGGVALKMEKAGIAFQIGTLVYVRQDGHFWGIGVVRWFRTGVDGALTAGIRFLPGQPHAVTLFPSDGHHVYPAVLVHPDNAASDASVGVVLPAAHRDVGGRMEMRQNGERYWLTLEMKADSSADINYYRGHVVAMAPAGKSG